jgi:hypothetical protein
MGLQREIPVSKKQTTTSGMFNRNPIGMRASSAQERFAWPEGSDRGRPKLKPRFLSTVSQWRESGGLARRIPAA